MSRLDDKHQPSGKSLVPPQPAISREFGQTPEQRCAFELQELRSFLTEAAKNGIAIWSTVQAKIKEIKERYPTFHRAIDLDQTIVLKFEGSDKSWHVILQNPEGSPEFAVETGAGPLAGQKPDAAAE